MDKHKGKILTVNSKDRMKLRPGKIPSKADNDNEVKKKIGSSVKLNVMSSLEKYELNEGFIKLKEEAETKNYSTQELEETIEALLQDFNGKKKDLAELANNQKNYPALRDVPVVVLAIYKILTS
jgi:hypothetical protein